VINKRVNSDVEAFLNTLRDMRVLLYRREDCFHVVLLDPQYVDLAVSIAAIFLSRYTVLQRQKPIREKELAFLSYTTQESETLLIGRRLNGWPDMIPVDTLTRLTNIREVLDRPGSPQTRKCEYCPLKKSLELGMSMIYCQCGEDVEDSLQSLCSAWKPLEMTSCAECKDFLMNIIINEPDGVLARTLLKAMGFDLCERWSFPSGLLQHLIGDARHEHDDALLSIFMALAATAKLGEMDIAIGAKVECGHHSFDPDLTVRHDNRYLFVEFHTSDHPPFNNHFYKKQGMFLAIFSNTTEMTKMLYFHISDKVCNLERVCINKYCTAVLIPRDDVLNGPGAVVKKILVPEFIRVLEEC